MVVVQQSYQQNFMDSPRGFKREKKPKTTKPNKEKNQTQPQLTDYGLTEIITGDYKAL